jgi:hypothetical protein
MSFLFGGSSTVKEYQRYRNAGRELNQKMIETYIDESVLEKAARLLKLGKNRRLVLDTQDDLSVLMDFALYEIKQNGKNIIERYTDEKGGRNFIERELLSAMTSAKVGLFKLDDVDKNNCHLRLSSLIDIGQSITLTDINFSQTMPNGLLIFFRPIQFSKLAMTSGIAFVFPQELEQELITNWHKLETKNLQRYSWFFKRSKNTGFETMYA